MRLNVHNKILAFNLSFKALSGSTICNIPCGLQGGGTYVLKE